MTALASLRFSRARRRSLVRRTLLGVESLMGGAAAICGPLLILTDGLGMDRAELKDTPFETFVAPGIVLGLVVGGSLLGAAWLVWRDRPKADLASLGGGGVLLGWIIVESIMIHGGRGLQAFVTLASLAIIGLALELRRWSS